MTGSLDWVEARKLDVMTTWQGQRVIIVGAARQGLALARYFASHGAQVLLNDQRTADKLREAVGSLADLPVEWVCGEHPFEILDGADWVCPSGGVSLTLPLVQEALRRGIPLTNDSQVFLEMAPCKVIGITGSAGKTTTTTLVGRMAQTGHAGKVWVGGNIGNPLIAQVDRMQSEDLAVMELSSFQLEIMTCSPQVAAVLNITPNHLDRHGTMEAYSVAKARILTNQQAERGDIAVLGCDDPGAWSLANVVKGSLWRFGMQADPGMEIPGAYLREDALWLWDGVQESLIMPLDTIQLRGQHNQYNVLAACAICAAVGLPISALRAGVEGFKGVAHRLEFVRSYGGADWYNDSIATAPERAMAAVRSFDEPLVLLVGGRDKDLPWQEFADLIKVRVDHLIVFGEAAEIILRALGSVEPGSRPMTLTRCSGLKEAVGAAAALVEPGDVVLLSPGGTSFDEFRDFEDRGEAFRRWVSELS